MANATARPCPRCHALVPLALLAAHERWHAELDAVRAGRDPAHANALSGYTPTA